MRGRVRRSLWRNAIPCLLALLMMAPAVALAPPTAVPVGEGSASGVSASTDPSPAVPAGSDPLAWMDRLEIDHLERVAPEQAEAFRPFLFPAPDELPGYDALSEEDQRLAWHNWFLVTVFAAMQPGLPFGGAAQAEEDTNASAPGEFGKPRALRPLWNVESHGQPRDLHPADDDGATFLVTDRAVLRFPATGTTPDWMVKPGGMLGRTATADANGDGVLDIVLGIYNFYGETEPSIVVVDGSDGSVLFSGLTEEARLYTWTLTDTNGDGTQDLLGVDGRTRIVAYALDGTELYAQEIPDLPSPPPVSLPLVYLFMYYDRYASGGFADVDGDGVKDLAITSGYHIFLFAGVLALSPTTQTLSAYSGTDGSLLWQTPMEPPSSGYTFSYPVASGDLDGDGLDDLLFHSTRFTFTLGAYLIEVHSRVYSGLGGAVLSDDSYGYVCVMLVTCSPPIPSAEGAMPVAFADLDADGTEELIGPGRDFDPETGKTSLWLEGRAAAAVPGGPSEPLYEHPVLTGTYDELGVDRLRLRDVDGDGTPEVLVAVFTAMLDEDGALDSLETHHYVVTADGAEGGATPELYGLWDVDAAGNAYAWSVRDDRWGPIDASAVRTTDGFRLIVSMAPLSFFDHTGDKVPDMLLGKTLGYMWVDGTTGALLDDVVRPIEVDPDGVFEERGRLYILERDYGHDEFAFIDIETFTENWRIAREDLAGGWIGQLVDVTGDARLDIVSEDYDFHYDTDSDTPLGGPESFRVSEERTVQILDMTTGEAVWERTLDEGHVRFADALPQRPGTEILLHERDEETRSRTVSMLVLDEEEPRWTYNLGTDGWFVRDGDGYLLMRNEQEGVVYEIVSGDNGELVSSVPLPADTSSQQVFFTKVNADRFPDLVVSYTEEDGGDDYTVQVLVHDWAEEKEIARYTLVGNGEDRFRRIESGIYLYVPEVGFASAEVGDWDRDGLVDFAYREADRALVRSTADGEVLALAPGAGTMMFTPDLNGDGRSEVGMITDRGRLRFFAYSPDVAELAEEDESSVRTVKEVNGTETETGADGFFDGAEENGLPAPGFGLAVLLLALVAFVVRRRYR